MTRVRHGFVSRRLRRGPLRQCVGPVVTVLAVLVSPVWLDSPAHAAPSGSMHAIPYSSSTGGVTMLCYDATGFSCASAGYNGTAGQIGGSGWATWQYWSSGSGGTQKHNCTTYAGYRLQQDGVAFPGWTSDAKGWDDQAWSHGTNVDQTPAVGAIAQWNGGSTSFGHVAYVEAVTGSYVELTSDNHGGGTNRFRISNGSGYMPDNYIHFKDLGSVAQYAGHVVQWNGDTKAEKTSWYVTPDLKRLWIPDSATYNCLIASGAAGPDLLGAQTLGLLPDQVSKWVPCGSTMYSNRTLRRGMSLRSDDGRYLLAMQGDGNLVLYYTPFGRALWATYQVADFVIVQGDGNVVAYRDNGTPVWSSGSAGSGANRLVVQNDGNVVLYAPTRAVWSTGTYYAGEAGHVVQWNGDTKTQKTSWYVTPDLRRLWIPDSSTYNCLKSRGAPGPDMLTSAVLNRLPDQTGIWVPCGDTMATNRALRRGMSLTSSDGRYRLIEQVDGNLVLYYVPTGHAIWATYRFNADFAILQGDGNLVVYRDGGTPVWSSNTVGTGADHLAVQTDGNVVLYAGSRPIWATNTVGRT